MEKDRREKKDTDSDGKTKKQTESEREIEREASKLELIGGGRIGGTERRVARSASAPQATSH